jgi:hypothetical protein
MNTTIDDLFPSRYLKAADLKGQKRVLTISKLTSEQVDRKKEKDDTVIYFQKCTKGLVLNKTNAKKIAEIVGSKTIGDWPGKAVTLYPKMVEFAGDLVEAIRVDYPNGAAAIPLKSPAPAASAASPANENHSEPPAESVFDDSDDVPF